MKSPRHRNRWRSFAPIALAAGLFAGTVAPLQAVDDESLLDFIKALPPETRVTLSTPDAAGASTSSSEPSQTPGPGQVARGFTSILVRNLADDVKHLPRRNSLYWVIGGATLALAVHPEDKRINRHLLGSPAWDHFFIPGKYVGATEVQIAAAFTTYAVGRARGADHTRHLGMDLIEAQLLTEGLVEGLKAIGRRPRPLNPDGTPNSTTTFSFPSGHAAVTFATATVLEQHLGWEAAVPTYLIASYVAMSRLHDNRHYLSDVVFGTATGIIVGRAVTWHGRNNYPIAMVVGPNMIGMDMEWK